MRNIIDAEVYKRFHPLRIAYLDGKLSMCEDIKELAQIIIANNNINPFRPTTEYQDGQLAALVAIIDACTAIENSAEKPLEEDFLFDA